MFPQLFLALPVCSVGLTLHDLKQLDARPSSPFEFPTAPLEVGMNILWNLIHSNRDELSPS